MTRRTRRPRRCRRTGWASTRAAPPRSQPLPSRKHLPRERRIDLVDVDDRGLPACRRSRCRARSRRCSRCVTAMCARQLALDVDRILVHLRVALVLIDEVDRAAGAGQQARASCQSAAAGRPGTGCRAIASGTSLVGARLNERRRPREADLAVLRSWCSSTAPRTGRSRRE